MPDVDDIDLPAIVRETIDFLTVRAAGDDPHRWIGDAPYWFGERLFGGFVIGQAVHAATRTAPPGRRIHSLHGYFLRPLLAGKPVAYTVRPLRDGRTFALRHLSATQDGEPVFEMSCSFTEDGDGYEYQLPLTPMPPPPDELEQGWGPGPWRSAWLGPTEPDADGIYRSTHRAWFRVGLPLTGDDDDPHVHAALLGFLSDVTGTGGRPRRLEGDTMGMVSLDHALWFHRPARADEWHFYDVHSLVNAGGRGLLRGALYDGEGRLVLSLAQEMLLRPVG